MGFDVIVIGAGPAGMTAAIAAAEKGARTAVIEPNEKVGRKLAITGKGRCNVTNDSDIDTVLKNIPRNPRFMYSSLSAFSPADVKEFFVSLGVPLKTERGNRVFPVSDKAYDIVDALFMQMKKLSVHIIHDRARDIVAENGKVCAVVCANGEYRAKAVIIATGGLSYPVTGSTGDGYAMAKKLGHTVTDILPSLVPLETRGGCAELAGLSLRNVVLSVFEIGKKKPVFREQGEMLFTHTGISGPLVLSASSLMGKITEGRYKAVIDLKPALDEAKLSERLLRDFSESANVKLANAVRKLLPESLILPFLREAKVSPDKQVNAVTRQERAAMISVLKAFPMEITGYRPISEAIITDGGINIKEIDPGTMASKLIGGLFFAGEIIDVTGFTGGFNLQIAFSTGHCAGVSAAESLNG